MTTIEPSTAPATEAAADVPISAVAPHPDNVRQHLGDLTELVRSIKSHGVLQPLLVLPADDEGVHLVVAGHRRLAAATRAGVERVPIVVRDLDRAAVIEAMLIENGHRSDLNVREEVDAIATLISIDTGVTPAKLSKRIGKSQRWVRDRMAITVLPTPAGSTSSATATSPSPRPSPPPAAPTSAPTTSRASAPNWPPADGGTTTPTRTVERYRRRIKLDADEAAAIAKCDKGQVAYFTIEQPAAEHGPQPRCARPRRAGPPWRAVPRRVHPP